MVALHERDMSQAPRPARLLPAAALAGGVVDSCAALLLLLPRGGCPQAV